MTNSTQSKRRALYPGSFDPITNGHLDVIRRASRLFDELIVGIGRNQSKKAIFSEAERVKQIENACREMTNVRIETFDGLLTEALKSFDACAVIRGLRAVSDFEWELQMALMNRELEPHCETIFLMPSPEYLFVSSTMIREIAELGGDISPFVPQDVAEALYRKFQS
jgi:pantetheine-phosphate adenylyltransferase